MMVFSHKVSKNVWINWNKKKNDGLFLNMPRERTKAQMRTRVGQTFLGLFWSPFPRL